MRSHCSFVASRWPVLPVIGQHQNLRLRSLGQSALVLVCQVDGAAAAFGCSTADYYCLLFSLVTVVVVVVVWICYCRLSGPCWPD